MADATLSTVRNAAQLLKAFATDPELGVSELGRRLRLGKSSVHRLLTTLRREGLVEQDRRTGRYRLSILMLELGESVRVRMDVRAAALAVLARLREQTGESAHVGVPEGDHVVYVEHMETASSLRTGPDTGWRLPMHCTSSGKVLLAFRPEPARDEYLAHAALTPFTRHTITDRARLREELVMVRARGWAQAVNEREVGVASLAAPIRDGTETVVGAISIRTPVARFRGVPRRRLALAVVQAGEVVSRRLGWSEEPARPAPPGKQPTDERS
jgi:IclR family KDG regulon transcriptional repressor